MKPVMTRGTMLDVPARYPPYDSGKERLLNLVTKRLPDGVVSFLNTLLAPATWLITAAAGSAAIFYSRAVRAA